MKISRNSFLLWLLLSIFIIIPIYLEPDFYQEKLFYPRDFFDILLGSILVFTLPYTIASLLKLRLETKTLSSKTLLSIFLYSFIINTILFSVFVFALNTLDSPSLNNSDTPKILIIIIQVVLILLCLLPFLFSPLIMHRKKVIIEPWWSVLLLFISILILIFLVSLLLGGIDVALAEFANELGGHYYTWLNFIQVALIVTTVIATGIRLGKCWTLKLDS